MIFDYPEQRPVRRHGPAGYTTVESFRPWLRDEFDFRCVYCLNRESWGRITGDFEIDHFEPQSIRHDLRLDYRNLVYACRRCNAVKRDQSVSDPFQLLRADNLRVQPDGFIEATEGEVQQLDLNAPRLKAWRVMWMRIVALAAAHEAHLYAQMVGLPADVPNLRRLRPPVNTRPQGLNEAWFERLRQGESPLIG